VAESGVGRKGLRHVADEAEWFVAFVERSPQQMHGGESALAEPQAS